VPASREPATADRAVHSTHLPALLEEMQAVARLEAPETEW
jgi:hypothetical protein